MAGASRSEPWFRAHAEIDEKRVAYRLMEATGCTYLTACGALFNFWGKLSRAIARGDVDDRGTIRDVPDALIERWAHWDGEAGAFARFIREKHCDRYGRVNECDLYNGPLIRQREQTRARVKAFRDREAAMEADLEASRNALRNGQGNALPNSLRSSIVVEAKREKEPEKPKPRARGADEIHKRIRGAIDRGD